MKKLKLFRGLSNRVENPITQIVHTELSDYLRVREATHQKTALATAQKLSTLDYDSLPETAKIPDFIGSLVANHQEDVDVVESKFSGDLQKVKGQSKIADSNEATVLLDRKIEEIDEQLTPIVGGLDNSVKVHAPAIKFYTWLIIPLSVLISGIELIANYEIFSLLGGGLYSNIAIATLVAISVYWYGHFTPRKVKEYGNGNSKRSVAMFIWYLILPTVLFYLLSTLRINYLLKMNPEMSGVFTTNPLVFTLTNVFAYIIICWLVKEYKPEQQIRNAYKKFKKDSRDIRKLKKRKIKLLEERSLIAPELRERLTDHYNILLLGKQKELEIVSRMQSCFEQFKLELFLKTNGKCASLFTGDIEQDLPKLRLNYQDVEPKLQVS